MFRCSCLCVNGYFFAFSLTNSFCTFLNLMADPHISSCSFSVVSFCIHINSSVHPHLFNSSYTATAQKPLPPIRHICGLGASVGCERVERTFNTPRLKSQICLIRGNGFVCSSLNELNSNPLTFCSILFIVRILIRLTEVSGMNHMKYKTLIADRLGNSCLDAGFFISDKIIFYPISLIRSNFKSLLSHVLKKMFFQTCSKERKIKL